MNMFTDLCRDESGLILSAEAVTIGTVGVLGAVVGMHAVGNAVDGELKEMASAIRSLDQSYAYVGHRGCGAWTAGSYYIQPDVKQSLADLSADGAVDIKAIQERIDADRKSYSKTAPQPQGVPQIDPQLEPMPTPLPNQIPENKKRPEPPTKIE